MAIATRQHKPEASTDSDITGSRVTSEQVWKTLDSASFAVLAYTTPTGEPRSSGVVYKTVGERLYTAVALDSWKARHIAASRHVSVTVPVRRGGILSLILPIPPATITFQATAIVHPAGSISVRSLSRELYSMLPPERRDAGVLMELIPGGTFLTYGLGVSLMDMRKPQLARGRVRCSS